jgi:ferritin-like metal-binding protein YciE
MKLGSFKDLYVEELRDLYDAEQQLLRALPDLAEAVVLPKLQEVFARHISETTEHVARLEHILGYLGVDPKGNSCKTMTGLISECNDLIREEAKADPGVLEAALIAGAQKIEHFEMAGYGCARTFAQVLGERDAAELLQRTLNEEWRMNQMLNQIAFRFVNAEAVEATEETHMLERAVAEALEAASHAKAA